MRPTLTRESIRGRAARVLILTLMLTTVGCICDPNLDPDGCLFTLFDAPPGVCPLHIPSPMNPRCGIEVEYTDDPNCPDCSSPGCHTTTVTLTQEQTGRPSCIDNCYGRCGEPREVCNSRGRTPGECTEGIRATTSGLPDDSARLVLDGTRRLGPPGSRRSAT